MNKTIHIFWVFTVLINSVGYSQISDLAKIDYTILPASNSDDIEYNRTRVLFNYPVKLKKEKTYLLLGLDYSNINLRFKENPSFDRDELDEFQILDFNIAYTTPLKNDWRLGVRLTPGFSSNLSTKDFSFEDIVLSSDVVFIKDKTKSLNIKKPWRLIIGVSYSGNRGFSFPLPFVSYYRKINTKWSFNLGIPKTNLQYHLSEKHRLKLYAELDGFTSNLQRGVLLDNEEEEAESINMSLILSGLQYEYHITKNIQFYARSSYILSNSIKLRDNDKDNIDELDNSNDLYFRTGVRLKI